MHITLFSFGFKHGYPEADLVWDVRFLPNPYWEPALKAFSGRDARIADYVLANSSGEEFLALLTPLLRYLLASYTQTGRESVTLAVGCTGGRHRSVALIEYLGMFVKELGYSATISHRDIEKD